MESMPELYGIQATVSTFSGMYFCSGSCSVALLSRKLNCQESPVRRQSAFRSALTTVGVFHRAGSCTGISIDSWRSHTPDLRFVAKSAYSTVAPTTMASWITASQSARAERRTGSVEKLKSRSFSNAIQPRGARSSFSSTAILALAVGVVRPTVMAVQALRPLLTAFWVCVRASRISIPARVLLPTRRSHAPSRHYACGQQNAELRAEALYQANVRPCCLSVFPRSPVGRTPALVYRSADSAGRRWRSAASVRPRYDRARLAPLDQQCDSRMRTWTVAGDQPEPGESRISMHSPSLRRHRRLTTLPGPRFWPPCASELARAGFGGGHHSSSSVRNIDLLR